jgi:hypothetical protein
VKLETARSGLHFDSKKDRGTCRGVRLPRKAADARLLTAVRGEVFDGSALQQVRRQVRELLDRAQREADQMSRDAARRVIELEREVERPVDAIARVGVSDALAARLRRAESELDVVRRHAASSPAAAAKVVKDSQINAAFKRLAMRLQDHLKGNVTPRDRFWPSCSAR